jgi:hypothetical protein
MTTSSGLTSMKTIDMTPRLDYTYINHSKSFCLFNPISTYDHFENLQQRTFP